MSAGPFRLDGRRALITGASGGIGKAIATLLHAQGAVVVLTGTRRTELDRLAQDLGDRVVVQPAALDDPRALPDLLAAAGPLDVLVNNAGISRREATGTTSDEAWAQVMDVNLGAVFRLCRAVLPGMAERGHGRIVQISSILAATGAAGMGAYCASKAGMVALTKSLALEYAARGVTANAVAPGYIRTPMMDMNPPEAIREILSRIPVGFFGEPDDVAHAVLYLASDAARFVTGETLHINGGMAMV